MKIGIIGIGVIGSSLTKGFLYDDDKSHHLYLSPRNERLSSTLEKKYSQVTRCESNQAVVDCSEIVFISVLPKVSEEVLKTLTFRKSQHIVNLVSDMTLERLKIIIGETASLTHMVPLSFIESRKGPIALFPRNAYIEHLLKPLGHIVAVDNIQKIKAIVAITGLMTSYYQLLDQTTEWGIENGLTEDESKCYTTLFFEALSQHGSANPLKILAKEMTPGGLNEMALLHLTKTNALGEWHNILELILRRLE